MFKYKLIIAFAFASFIGCADDVSYTDLNANINVVPQNMKIEYQSKPANISDEDIGFANEKCSYYGNQTKSGKRRCRQIIESLCSHIDVYSKDVEKLPLWRPSEPPVTYFRAIKRVSRKKLKNHFVCSIYAYLHEEFLSVLEERQEAIRLYNKSLRKILTPYDLERHFVLRSQHDYNSQMDNFRRKKSLADGSISQPDSLDPYEDLVRKIDVMPISLMITFAIHESGWGTSDLALRARNVWGRTATKNCSKCVHTRDPSRRGETFIRYSNFRLAVADQYRYFNRLDKLRSLRDMRYQRRQSGLQLSSYLFTEHLKAYNSEDKNYERKLKNFLRYDYPLEKYDVFDHYISPRPMAVPNANY